jgi:hypothetical protein
MKPDPETIQDREGRNLHQEQIDSYCDCTTAYLASAVTSITWRAKIPAAAGWIGEVGLGPWRDPAGKTDFGKYPLTNGIDDLNVRRHGNSWRGAMPDNIVALSDRKKRAARGSDQNPTPINARQQWLVNLVCAILNAQNIEESSPTVTKSLDTWSGLCRWGDTVLDYGNFATRRAWCVTNSTAKWRECSDLAKPTGYAVGKLTQLALIALCQLGPASFQSRKSDWIRWSIAGWPRAGVLRRGEGIRRLAPRPWSTSRVRFLEQGFFRRTPFHEGAQRGRGQQFLDERKLPNSLNAFSSHEGGHVIGLPIRRIVALAIDQGIFQNAKGLVDGRVGGRDIEQSW